MFDDTKKYLNDLDAKLRAEKYEEELEKLVESPDDFDLDAILGAQDPLPWEDPAPSLPQEDDIPIRNHANGYGARPYPGQVPQRPRPAANDAVNFSRAVYEDQVLDEKQALLDEKPRKKGIGGLWLVLLLEIAGILAIVLWWVRWLL